jgi:hypothetical protein
MDDSDFMAALSKAFQESGDGAATEEGSDEDGTDKGVSEEDGDSDSTPS